MIRVALCLWIALSFAAPSRAQSQIELQPQDDRVAVLVDGELFTNYIFKGYEKPILYPVIGPHGIRMTRDYPMQPGTPHEADDHPHHKSIWFGHMKVNGESFWHVGDTAGTTKHLQLTIHGNTLHTTNQLLDRYGRLVATDSREIRFFADGDTRMIDYAVTYHASESEILFGDNKDGQMGIRLHPKLRIKGPVAAGKAINSEGVREDKIWGKRAEWIDYWGEIDGHVVGVAMFDHPSNLRHPTWWHARDYGLLSANPFGIHHFESKDDEHAGDHRLPRGESLTFQHRFVFHAGDYEAAKIDQRYRAWTTSH